MQVDVASDREHGSAVKTNQIGREFSVIAPVHDLPDV
jgi:hypothetical protein